MEDVTITEAVVSVVGAVGVLLSAIITGVIVPFIRSKTTHEQRDLAYGIVTSAVGMMEQIGKAQGWEGAGKVKKERATSWIKRRFKKLGIEFEEDEVNGWIEDAVDKLGASLEDLMALEEAELEKPQ